MFIPMTRKEMEKLGWDELDVILVTGDAYIDLYFDGTAVIGKYLIKHGFRVGVVSQPDIETDADILCLREPCLFWGVSAGIMDSMVANYTASGLKRKKDDLTPGGINNRRPDRAVLKYTNLIKRFSKKKAPVVIGGVEASLRRFSHYDFKTDKIRGSVLSDSKADILVFGMGEKPILEIAENLKNGFETHDISGTCYMTNQIPEEVEELPSFEDCAKNKDSFIKMTSVFMQSMRKRTKLFQKQGSRFVVQNPPAEHFSTQELDDIHEMDFERMVHPECLKNGEVRAIETIKNSVVTHRGCFGTCTFCSIAAHQGSEVVSRSEDSILREVEKLTEKKDFNGVISDLGGPTANMYGMDFIRAQKGHCVSRDCLYPNVCKKVAPDHSKQLSLLRKVREIKGVKHVFVASGIRYDLIVADKLHGKEYLEEIVRYHISGQMKIAPEHTEPSILSLMKKPSKEVLLEFSKMFEKAVKESGKKTFLTYYLIAAFPGSDFEHQKKLKDFISRNLRVTPEQVQIFTPTPSTEATMMYWTERTIDGVPIFVEKGWKNRRKQKDIVTGR